MKRKYLVILSLILCISLALSSVSAAIVASDDGDDSNDIQDNDNDNDIKNNDKINKKSAVKTESISTHIHLDQEKIPSSKPSTVTAKVYATFNGAHTLVKTGTISLYINGEKQQTIDLSSCNGVAKFSIPALHENKNCKIVYDGGIYKDSEFNFKLSKSSSSIVVGDDKEALPSIIKVVPNKISGVSGSLAKISVKVVFEFNGESIASDGNLHLLKDGKTIQVVDLSRNCNPSFSFKLENNHKYSLVYDGAEDMGEFDIDLLSSSKDLNVNVLKKPTPTNKTINQTTNKTINQTTNMTINQTINQTNNLDINNEPNNKSTSLLLPALIIVIIVILGLVVYLRKR